MKKTLSVIAIMTMLIAYVFPMYGSVLAADNQHTFTVTARYDKSNGKEIKEYYSDQVVTVYFGVKDIIGLDYGQGLHNIIYNGLQSITANLYWDDNIFKPISYKKIGSVFAGFDENSLVNGSDPITSCVYDTSDKRISSVQYGDNKSIVIDCGNKYFNWNTDVIELKLQVKDNVDLTNGPITTVVGIKDVLGGNAMYPETNVSPTGTGQAELSITLVPKGQKVNGPLVDSWWCVGEFGGYIRYTPNSTAKSVKNSWNVAKFGGAFTYIEYNPFYSKTSDIINTNGNNTLPTLAPSLNKADLSRGQNSNLRLGDDYLVPNASRIVINKGTASAPQYVTYFIIVPGDMSPDGEVVAQDISLLMVHMINDTHEPAATENYKLNEIAADVWFDHDLNTQDGVQQDSYAIGIGLEPVFFEAWRGTVKADGKTPKDPDAWDNELQEYVVYRVTLYTPRDTDPKQICSYVEGGN